MADFLGCSIGLTLIGITGWFLAIYLGAPINV